MLPALILAWQLPWTEVSRLTGEELIGPAAIVVDAQQRLIVLDQLDGSVKVYDPKGKRVERIDGLGDYLAGAALGPDGDLYVLLSDRKAYEILVLDSSFKRKRLIKLSGLSKIEKPSIGERSLLALELDAKGRFYILSHNGDETLVFDPKGKIILERLEPDAWLCPGETARAALSKEELFDRRLACGYETSLTRAPPHRHFLYRNGVKFELQKGLGANDYALGPERDCWLSPGAALYCRGGYAEPEFRVYRLDIGAIEPASESSRLIKE